MAPTVDVITQTEIRAPLERVASFASDPENVPLWYANIKSVVWRSSKGVGLGARIAFVARFLGRTIEYTYEIVELEPHRRLVMRTTDGPFPMETTYEWTPVSSSETRMSLRNRGHPSGFSRMAAPLLARAIKRANTRDLARLKGHLENPTADTQPAQARPQT